MSAAAQAAEAIPAPPAKGKKKLIIVVAAALLVTTLVGGGAVFFLKKKAAAAAAEAADEDTPGHAAKPAKHDPAHVPTFLPLEPFVVNLADKDADRYAQIGITLEIDDAKFAEQLKAYMPAIRNGILMVLAHKTSGQLLDRAGKLALADEIMREAVRPLGIEVEEAAAEPVEKHDDEADEDKPKVKKKPKKKTTTEHNPVRRVHFSNFIIQ
jgi:flagellar FliL protein